MTPVGNGIDWPVGENCGKYDLTREQKEQKSEKRQRSRPYVATANYSGYKLPVVHGFRVFCSPPCTDEARMAIHPGDRLVVTRSTKLVYLSLSGMLEFFCLFRNWFFGERVRLGPNGENLVDGKGWFPRCCAVPLEGGDKKTS